MATRSVTTRAKNATQHPGHIVEKDKKKRRTKEEVQLERQAKEDAKVEKARLKADGIKRVAAYEQSQADDDAAEATPRAPPPSRQLRRTRSYALIPQYEDEIPDSDVDMGDVGDVGDTDAYRSADGSVFDINDGDDDTKTEPVLTSPPRKKTRAEKKAAKPKVRAAVEAAQIKAAQVKELEKAKGGRKRLPMVDDDDDDVIDLDPTPVKRKRTAVPAAESDDDLSEAMSIGGKDNVEVIPRPRRDEGKGKGKLDANTLKADRRDQKVGSNQTVPDAKRVPPESKNDSASNDTSKAEKFLSGINGWAASIPRNSKPVSKALSKPGTNKTGTSRGDILPPLTNATTRSSASSVLTKNVTISQRTVPGVKLEPGGVSIFDGALSDEDEANGIERDAAIASPPKGKKRVTSSDLVVQSPVKTVPTVTKRIKKPGNNDLPDGVDSKLWRPVFVSTYLQYIGSTTNPWEVPVKTACKIMQLIWDAIFPDIPHTITSTSPVYIITNQRAADSWRSVIGSAGVTIVLAALDSQDELRDSDDARVEFAKYALDHCRFTFKKSSGDVDNFRGLFRGPLVLQTFATHFTAISGARKIDGVDDPDKGIAHPRGALALCCAAVERALALISTRSLTIDMVRAAKGKAITLPKTMNYFTGKNTKNVTGFNDGMWGERTRSYLKSVDKNLKDDAKFNAVIRGAMEFAKSTRRVEDTTSGSRDNEDEDEDDERAQLVDRSDSGSDDDDDE